MCAMNEMNTLHSKSRCRSEMKEINTKNESCEAGCSSDLNSASSNKGKTVY